MSNKSRKSPNRTSPTSTESTEPEQDQGLFNLSQTVDQNHVRSTGLLVGSCRDRIKKVQKPQTVSTLKHKVCKRFQSGQSSSSSSSSSCSCLVVLELKVEASRLEGVEVEGPPVPPVSAAAAPLLVLRVQRILAGVKLLPHFWVCENLFS